MLIEAALITALIRSRQSNAVAVSLRTERAEHYDRRDRVHAVRAARSRWLHRHDAESSFPCGVVHPVPPRPDIETAPPLPAEVPVIAAVLPEVLAFLVDPPDGYPGDDPIEAGAVPRAAVSAVEVERDGEPVDRPTVESFDDEPACAVVLRWGGDEQRLWFRSAWLAWRTADRFRDATGG